MREGKRKRRETGMGLREKGIDVNFGVDVKQREDGREAKEGWT